jgi:phosphoglycerate dehydrogenase-like enzyme
MSKTVAVLSAMARSLIEPQLPDWVDAHYFASTEELMELAPLAEIGWFDLYNREDMAKAIEAGTNLKWLNTIYAGVDGFPLDLLDQRGVTFTNGAGINALTIAEYIVMAMLTVAKGYREIVRAQDRHDWLQDSPGKVELSGTKALILGYGAIGKLTAERLKPFGVDVTAVRRSAGPDTLTPDQWRSQLGEFDWVIIAVPATPDTDHMIGVAELAAMKPTATLLNFARGAVVDQDALIDALTAKAIGSAFLDVTTPEPLPSDHPLWTFDNCHISMHLSGRAQDKMFPRSVARFIENLARYRSGERLEPQVDFKLGY